jgi:hypothetical protein
MSDLAFFGIDAPWWPYLFILLAGWLPTDVWRYLGVLSANSISEDSTAMQLVRAIATALVAAVIARLVLYPSGSLAEIPSVARIGGLAVGFAVYYVARRSIVLGILASQIVLLAGAWQAGLL